MSVIEVRDLNKIYKIYDRPKDRFKEMLNPFSRTYHKPFYALKDVSFDIEKGETIGIVGQNGSGKSTLLKILTGVLTPTSGIIKVDGKVSALLELGAGFNPEMTGIENIYLNGTIMGYSKDEMNEKMDSILSFADIGDFVNQPVKTYSSGMFVRLAFSVATNVKPDILIVDEALSVGDLFFQAKCMSRMKQMVDDGITLLFVSHDPAAIKSVCQKSIWLEKGAMIGFDKSEVIIEKYFAKKVQTEQTILDSAANKDKSETGKDLEISSKNMAFKDNAEFLKRASFQRIQNGKADFANIQLLNGKEQETFTVEYDQQLTLRMAIEVNEDLPSLAFGYHIRDKNGVDVIYTDSIIENKTLESLKKGEKYIIDWDFKASLIQGIYNITCVMSIPIDMEIAKVEFCDFVPLAFQFNMLPRRESQLYGLVHWDNAVEIEKI